MRKYYRLLLILLSIASLTLFLIYRREYNRLHYVLEVFNFFGQPCNISDLQRGENIVNHHDWGPIPTWQEQPGGHIYSAFLINPNEIKALGLINNDRTMPRNCYVWFEERKRPVSGKFKYSKSVADKYANMNLCYLICTVPAYYDVSPYAVSFSHKKEKFSELQKIMLTKTYNRTVSLNTTVCVSPHSYSKRQLIEFISYHKVVGVDSFLFYNREIPHRLVKLLSNLSVMLGLKLTFLPWNYPKFDSSLTRMIVEQECILRTLGQTLYAIVLETDEYIVPSSADDINIMMKQFNSSAVRLNLPVQKFCINHVESNKPVALLNTNVMSNNNNTVVRYIYKAAKSRDPLVTLVVHESQASIHKYVSCSLEAAKTYGDNSILRFSTDFTRSTLFQLYLHNQI